MKYAAYSTPREVVLVSAYSGYDIIIKRVVKAKLKDRFDKVISNQNQLE